MNGDDKGDYCTPRRHVTSHQINYLALHLRYLAAAAAVAVAAGRYQQSLITLCRKLSGDCIELFQL